MDAEMTSSERTKREAIHLIEWRNNLKGYFYGSTLHYFGRGWVRFENELMPPGTVIHRWKSEYNYQAERHEPMLVPLTPDVQYIVRAYWGCEQEDGLILRAIFFDSRGKEIEHVNSRGREIRFTCPESCCSWELQLINGGTRSLELYYLVLARTATLQKRWFRWGNTGKASVVIIGEPQGNTIVCPSARFMDCIERLAFIPVQYTENEPMLKNVVLPMVSESTVLIGYGPRSNWAAFTLARKLGCRGFASWERDDYPPMGGGGRIQCYLVGSQPTKDKRAYFPLAARMADHTSALESFPLELLP